MLYIYKSHYIFYYKIYNDSYNKVYNGQSYINWFDFYLFQLALMLLSDLVILLNVKC